VKRTGNGITTKCQNEYSPSTSTYNSQTTNNPGIYILVKVLSVRSPSFSLADVITDPNAKWHIVLDTRTKEYFFSSTHKASQGSHSPSPSSFLNLVHGWTEPREKVLYEIEPFSFSLPHSKQFSFSFIQEKMCNMAVIIILSNLLIQKLA